MINMMYLVLTALLALNVSSEILNAFKTVNKSLENTNTTVDKSTQTIMASLEQKTNDEATKTKALVWYPKAQEVQSLSKNIFSYVQGLKDQILREAGGDPKNAEQKFKEDNLDIATRIMITQGEGPKLLAELGKFKNGLLAIDPAIDSAFKTSLPINLDKPESKSKAGKTWEGAYFHMVPTVAALTILSKFQNDVKTSENRVVQFCHNKVGEVAVRFDTYAAIIGQNSNYLMPGQELEITAGVGAFSKAAAPVVTIGGQTYAIGAEGTATAKLPGGGVGSRTVPVRITYTDQEGKQQVIEKNVEYKVGMANASIALDEMNVLYVGYDNKVTIAASGGGDDRVQATITGGGGALQKIGNGKYIAKVNSVTDDCKITVSVDGKVAGVSQFRVRTIPQPVGTVGGFASGDNVNAGAFKAQSGVGAYIKDFPLNLRYTVTGFTITADDPASGDILEETCTGNLWSPRAQNMVKNLSPGRMVTIDNLRAQGPDGRVQKLPSLVYYIK
jgi:gliding motility-associated protein GldM